MILEKGDPSGCLFLSQPILNMKNAFSFLLTLLLYQSVSAQILSVDPVFPQMTDTVTIVYNAEEGNGALNGVSPVYAHTGVITNMSSSPTDWRYVQGMWGTPDASVLMTDLGGDLHQIRFHIQSYYGIPANEQVEQLAMVFRDANGNTVGRDTDGSDIFYPVYAPGQLYTAFLQPASDQLVNAGANIPVEFAASDSATLSLTDNGTSIFSAYAKEATTSITASGTGLHEVILTADDGNSTAKDTFYYTVNPAINFANPPSGTVPGINYMGDSTVVFYLYAPNKGFAYVLGDFNGYQANAAYFMNKTPDNSTFWLEVSGLTPGQPYTFQYAVDGNLQVADPYSELVLDPNNDQYIPSSTFPNLPAYPTGLTQGIVSVIETGQAPFAWQNPNYAKPDEKNLVVYELLMRDFLATHDYQTLIDTLDYLERLGITAIELMPVNEFEGNESWGYNPSFHMALDKYYGTKESFQQVIDACHARGIMVILDVVYNHAFSQSPLCQLYWDQANFKPSPDNPWLNPDARHPFNVGYDFDHESSGTRQFVKQTLAYWMTEYKIDGFRFDLSKGFTQTNTGSNVGAWGQYDASRIAILKDYYDFSKGINPDAYLILEHFSDNSEETELANYGFLFWGNLNDPYSEAALGFNTNSNFSWINYQQRNWNDPHVVGYMESHDEERLMYKNLNFGNSSGPYNVRDLSTALKRMELAGALFFPIPGPKMIWMFGEIGYDVGYDDPCQLCNKPILWNYYQEPERRHLFQVWRALIDLKKTYPAFQSTNFDVDVTGEIKTVRLYDNAMDVVTVGNFGVEPRLPNVSFPHGGWWYEYFTGDSIQVNGSSQALSFDPGEYRLYTDVSLPAPDLTVPVSREPSVNLGFFPMLLWPNPSHGQAKLSYSLSEGAIVEVWVFDLTGREVAHLPQGRQARGEYQIGLDGTAWGAGEYIVRVQAGNRQAWKLFQVK